MQQDVRPGYVTAMLEDLDLPPLAERRKHQRLNFMHKHDYKTTNIVDRSARRNTRCFAVDTTKTEPSSETASFHEQL